ncbi:MAG: adenylosuccinate lyase [Bacteroidota bacterium]|nr:adenylosuccinate lyase [Bacteroidota bacterium]
MKLQSLTALSPLDGRYRSKIESLASYFSEFGLIKYRVLVEVEYFIALCELPLPELEKFPRDKFEPLRKIYGGFKTKDAETIKEIERTTNHDVKAVEYFLRNCWDDLGVGEFKEFIHFGLTSQDINNTAIPLSLKDAFENIFLIRMEAIIKAFESKSDTWESVPMLARTHGQPASPTRLGKEIQVFTARLKKQVDSLYDIKFRGKFGGATGNFNAHHVAYPKVNWDNFGNRFLKDKLGLWRNHPTTQIDHYDDLSAIFDNVKRINVILMDLCQDLWLYISMEYFRQKVKEGEVGSSAMPHKVNPIDFENAEGNLGLANAVFEYLSRKLPVSRLQRDLTDSTVLRNIGVPIGHSYLAYDSILKGLEKLVLNEEKLKEDLENNWAVVAEAIQTILRKEGYAHPYEALKNFTRGKSMLNQEVFESFIDSLDINNELKSKLKAITPHNYTGIV